MAYGNWGAFVFCDGKRRRDCEDVPVFGDRSDEAEAQPGARIWINLIKLRAAGKLESSPWWERAHHAVLGDGPIRLCGYKSSPELWRMDGDTPTRVEIRDRDEDYNRLAVSGEIDGCSWYAEPTEGPEGVNLTFVEADGKRWSAACGYCIGSGHDESDPDDDGTIHPSSLSEVP